MFQNWSRSHLILLLESIHLKKFYKEKVVLSEGENSKYFYLVKEGELELSKRIIKESFNKRKH